MIIVHTWWSAKPLLRYGDLSVIKMAAVLHTRDTHLSVDAVWFYQLELADQCLLPMKRKPKQYPPAKEGLLSGDWCQQRSMQSLMCLTSVSGPLTALSGGRWPRVTADSICAWFTATIDSKVITYLQTERLNTLLQTAWPVVEYV